MVHAPRHRLPRTDATIGRVGQAHFLRTEEIFYVCEGVSRGQAVPDGFCAVTWKGAPWSRPLFRPLPANWRSAREFPPSPSSHPSQGSSRRGASMLQVDGTAHTFAAKRRLATRPLADRRPRIARLSADDLPLIERFLLDTDIETRASRFGSVRSDAGLVAYARDTMKQARLLLGLFIDDSLRGVLEAHHCGKQRMEVALIVAHAFRRKGVGTALLREAVAHGELIDALTYQLIFAPDNWAMRRIAQKSNARLDLVLGEFCADIDLSQSR
jgi:GNAT superfamily N-acetyltransferase